MTRIVVALAALALACQPVSEAGRRPLAPRAHLAERRASHSTTLLADGTLLVAGGFHKGPDGYRQLYSRTTELVDVGGGRVRPGPLLGVARAGHLAVGLADGSLLIAGGANEDGELRSAELYRPGSGFTPVGELSRGRGGGTATLLADGRVLVAGGGEDAPSATTELYDPATGRFTPGPSMAEPRLGHTATLLADGTVLVAGGLARRGVVLASAELYDPRAGTFTPVGAMAAVRYKHAAALLADGRVIVAGGSDQRDWRGKSAATEIYDPATRRFGPGPALARPRFKLPHAVAVLADGRLAIAGGDAAVELLDPRAGSRVLVTLPRASYYGTATLVGDQLVVVGGYGDDVQSTDAIWTVAIR